MVSWDIALVGDLEGNFLPVLEGYWLKGCSTPPQSAPFVRRVLGRWGLYGFNAGLRATRRTDSPPQADSLPHKIFAGAQKKPGGPKAARLDYLRWGMVYLTNTDMVTLTVWPPGP